MRFDCIVAQNIVGFEKHDLKQVSVEENQETEKC